MIYGKETGGNMIVENKGYRKNKFDIGVRIEEVEQYSKKSITDNWEGSWEKVLKILHRREWQGMIQMNNIVKIAMYLVRNSNF